MRIFFLEDNPKVIDVISYLRDNGHTVCHASNLKDAACRLELVPGADTFELFLFDVGIPAENVRHLKNKRGSVAYANAMGFNGLLFLLHNIDLLCNHIERVSIVTAHRKQIMDMGSIDVFGRGFEQQNLSEKAEENRVIREQVPKIQYRAVDTGQVYTFSFLDKGGDNLIPQIEKFISKG